MSGALVKTGPGAVTLGVAGYSMSLPQPMVIAIVGVALVVTGAVLIRLSWRRNKAVSAR